MDNNGNQNLEGSFFKISIAQTVSNGNPLCWANWKGSSIWEPCWLVFGWPIQPHLLGWCHPWRRVWQANKQTNIYIYIYICYMCILLQILKKKYIYRHFDWTSNKHSKSSHALFLQYLLSHLQSHGPHTPRWKLPISTSIAPRTGKPIHPYSLIRFRPVQKAKASMICGIFFSPAVIRFNYQLSVSWITANMKLNWCGVHTSMSGN